MVRLTVSSGSAVPKQVIPWVQSLSKSEQSELAAIIAGTEDRWSKIEWGVISDWVEERGGRRAYSIYLDFEEEEPVGLPSPRHEPTGRMTIYLKTANQGTQHLEGRNAIWMVEPIDKRRHDWLIRAQYLPRRARTKTSAIVEPYPCELIILEGWGHAAPPQHGIPPLSSWPEPTSIPPPDVRFSAFLDASVATSGAAVLADFRRPATD